MHICRAGWFYTRLSPIITEIHHFWLCLYCSQKHPKLAPLHFIARYDSFYIAWFAYILLDNASRDGSGAEWCGKCWCVSAKLFSNVDINGYCELASQR